MFDSCASSCGTAVACPWGSCRQRSQTELLTANIWRNGFGAVRLPRHACFVVQPESSNTERRSSVLAPISRIDVARAEGARARERCLATPPTTAQGEGMKKVVFTAVAIASIAIGASSAQAADCPASFDRLVGVHGVIGVTSNRSAVRQAINLLIRPKMCSLGLEVAAKAGAYVYRHGNPEAAFVVRNPGNGAWAYSWSWDDGDRVVEARPVSAPWQRFGLDIVFRVRTRR